MADVLAQPAILVTQPNREALEMQAFEKGRIQGEIEATRRLEAEGANLKALPVVQQPVLLRDRPDVLEINRLTWVQRTAWVLGNLALLCTIALELAWVLAERPLNGPNGFGWSGSLNDAIGNVKMWNTGMLTFTLGLFLNASAITHYRVLPLNLSAHINRLWYITLQACAIVCYTLTLVALVRTSPEATFWSVSNWCFALAIATFYAHALYSMARAMLDQAMPVTYETWAEVSNRLEEHPTHDPETRGVRSGIAADQTARTIYTPAPIALPREAAYIPPASSNVGAQVPVAPANAPRWAELANTHAEDYFLLARAKWAVISFFAMGLTFCMILAEVQQVMAAGQQQWAQGLPGYDGYRLDEAGREAKMISGLGLVTLIGTAFMSYVAIPPRTTLVKNGGTPEVRRTSVSQTVDPTIEQQNIV